MKRTAAIFLSIIILMSILPISVSASETGKISPTSWAAVDGLGRTLSMNETVGDKKDNKFVGMFYWIWHYPWIADHEPITTGSVLDLYPEAVNDWEHPAWNGTYDGRPYFWDEPLFGFYSNTDEYVLRKHAELLADADIDTVIFDTTNSDIVFPEGYEALFRVWSQARKEGVDTPQVMFILNFGGKEETRSQLYNIYENIYEPGRYEDLWFMWEGKPLVMADVGSLDLKNKKDREIFNFFTFRDNESTYFVKQTAFLENTWGWCSDYPQTKFGIKLFGGVEQMCVSVAQNANENGLTAMNNPEGTVQGRSFTDGAFSYTYSYGGRDITVDKNIENSLLYGLNFQQQWDYAIEQDPEFIFITGFNEWIAGRFTEWNGVENAFPDQFSPEYSRDIEPSNGILKDHYYYQLVENVRRFKGADKPDKNSAGKTIDISGDISQWDDVYPEYNHYLGNTKNRDDDGWKGYHYTNNTMRNDIVQAKVAYDSENIYFYVKTAENLSPETDSDWMRLLIDTDPTGIEANWEGFEYVINRASPVGGKTVLEKSLGGIEFGKICECDYTVRDNVLQIKVPREALGLTDENIKFNFKWSDNLCGTDAMSFYLNGDSAPGGRFTFVFDSTATGEDIQKEDTCKFDCTNDLFEKIRNTLNSYYALIRKLCFYIFK